MTTKIFCNIAKLDLIKKFNKKKTKDIISIFAGRAGDTGKDPVPEPYNYLQAKKLACHIITIPPSTIEKIENFGKTFDQLTKETVKAFLVDSKKSKFKTDNSEI